MKEAKENTYLPQEEASEILENATSNFLPESEWAKIKAILIEKDCLKEENVEEGD